MFVKDMTDAILGNLHKATPGVFPSPQELEKVIAMAVNAALTRTPLVTREEFEIQQMVLAETRSKLEAMEAVVAELSKAQAESVEPPLDNAPDSEEKENNDGQ